MSNEILDKLSDVVVKGKIKEAKPLAEQALAAGVDPKIIIFDSLSKAMATVGQKYESKQYFLPQVLLAAQTMYQALDVVLPRMKVDTKAKQPGKIVLAVVEGDVHDIGKNILKAMLTGAGLTIYDLGRDVPVKNIIEKAKAESAQIIATSTLMTSTLVAMREIERMLAEENLKGKMKTIIGGGATNKEYSAQIGTDAWAHDAIEAVRVIDDLLA
ncbi:cobalamin B12-binding domain-containing protein [Methanomassiliicoccus luminyensis]|uniref:cobalamin B12-binding domain-containing protein n=1 Tax=Methanomassiliicoccus luminyensis TaxID=1080712 RepID=UPI00037D43C5|nr:cobalamin-dependent protein [Methanomassiliicoccus luminyensis]